MFKIIILFITTTLLFSVTNSKAQTGIANNNTWVVSKYWTSFTQEDKKDLFKDFTFQFIQADTSTFLAINNSSGIADTSRGFWHQEGSKISISLPLDSSNIEKYKMAMLLNRAEIQTTGVSSSLLSFTINELMDYILVEFTVK